MIKIDWLTDESHVLINPLWPSLKCELVNSALEVLNSYKGVVWLATSGTTAKSDHVKLVGLKKQAILHSAKAVNKHIGLTGRDIIFNSLPIFHIGGLSVLARSFCSGAQVISNESSKWCPDLFFEQLIKNKATVVSLVPSQIYDLVTLGIKAPKDLRVVFVGGGSLPQDLYKKSILLGWPLILTYGMTETSSQIATGRVSDLLSPQKPKAYLLKHIIAKNSSEGLLCFKSEALLAYYAFLQPKLSVKIVDPKESLWFQSDDYGSVADDGSLQVTGRKGQVIKVLGELVNIKELNEVLSDLVPICEGVIIPLPDLRQGHQLALVLGLQHLSHVKSIIKAYTQLVAPYEKIKKIYFVKNLHTNELGKVNVAQLQEDLGLM